MKDTRARYENEVKTSSVYKLMKDRAREDKQIRTYTNYGSAVHAYTNERGRKMYNEDTGYEKVYAKKVTENRQSLRTILHKEPPRQQGTEKDIFKAWEPLRRGAARVPNAKKVAVNEPYIILKDKNIRQGKKGKRVGRKQVRLRPETKHPMRNLFDSQKLYRSLRMRRENISYLTMAENSERFSKPRVAN